MSLGEISCLRRPSNCYFLPRAQFPANRSDLLSHKLQNDSADNRDQDKHAHKHEYPVFPCFTIDVQRRCEKRIEPHQNRMHLFIKRQRFATPEFYAGYARQRVIKNSPLIRRCALRDRSQQNAPKIDPGSVDFATQIQSVRRSRNNLVPQSSFHFDLEPF